MRIFLVCILVTLFSFSGQGQKRDVVYNASLSGFASTQKTLPFWAVSNRHGLMPNGNGTLLELGFYSDFTNKHKIQFAYGVSAGGYLSSPGNKIILDQLFVSARWRKLRLDLGMIQPEEEYNGVSSTNGDFVRSGNSRTFPGYNLRSDFIDIPGTKGITWLAGKVSMMRSMVFAAPTVCSEESRRCPVSAAVSAVCTVS